MAQRLAHNIEFVTRDAETHSSMLAFLKARLPQPEHIERLPGDARKSRLSGNMIIRHTYSVAAAGLDNARAGVMAIQLKSTLDALAEDLRARGLVVDEVYSGNQQGDVAVVRHFMEVYPPSPHDPFPIDIR